MATIAHHATSVTVRLAGDHETRVEPALDRIRVMIPGLIVTLIDLNAAWCLWKAWYEGAHAAKNIFNGNRATPYQTSPITTVQAAVTISGWQPGRQVWGKTANHSASGCGELRVRVGGLVIICDDREAFDRQLATWALAYDTGKRITWPGKLADV